MARTPTLRVLHVSDLHERGPRELEPYRRRLVLGDCWKRNIDDIMADGAIDLVCFTGDAATRGLSEEFEAATAFFDDLLAQLNLTRERLFVVPGNHDIARQVERPAWQALRDALARGADRLDLARWMAGLGEAPLGVLPDWRSALLARQSAYRAWLRDTLRRPDLAIEGALGYRVTLSLDPWPEAVHLIGLDTAWLAGDDADAGRLLLTDGQILRLATDERGRRLSGLRLGLMHHPFHDLADGHDSRHLAADTLDVVLRGHLHQTSLVRWQEPDRRFSEFAVGCLYEGHRADRYPNACHVLTFTHGDSGEPALHGESWFRAWSSGGGHWHDDDSLYRGSRSGRLNWSVRRHTLAAERPTCRTGSGVHAANPYDPWNPAVPPRFAGRGVLMRALDHALSDARSVAIVGDWRIGKSSVLRTWEEHARAAGRVCAWVSGEEATGQSPGAFVRGVTSGEAPDDPDGAAAVLHRWAVATAPDQLPPLVLIDEAEAIVRAFDQRFFERLRGLMGRHALVFAFSATDELDRIYERGGRTSPFHNLVETHWVGLVEKDAAERVAHFGARTLSPAEIASLLEWGGHHAFYVQLLGRYLVDARADGAPAEAAVERFQDEAGSRLRALWRVLPDRDKEVLRDNARAGRPISLRSLKRRGLATEDGRPFGRVLTEWLKENA